MRDINRLDDFYNAFKELHKNVYDWRFGQFVINFMRWYEAKYKRDIFYIEDNEIIKLIREFINEIGVKYA